MKKKFKKAIAVILTAAMTMSVGVPAFAAESIQQNQVVKNALSVASAEEKVAITTAIAYLEERGTFSIGELVAINSTRSADAEELVYVISYKDYDEEIVFYEISDDVVSYSVKQGEKYATIDKFSDGRLLLNGHGIDIVKTDSKNNTVSIKNSATNETTILTKSEYESRMTPYAVDINYTETCPYQTTRDYSVLAYEAEQSNVLLYEMFCEIPLSAFFDMIGYIYPPIGTLLTAWSVVSELYDFIGVTNSETEGLSYLEENYFHETCDLLSNGYIDALGYSVTKIITFWYAEPYYEGDWHMTRIYKTYERW